MRKIERFENCTIYLGDCLEIMDEIEKDSIDLVFTDPPYGHNNNNGDLISRWEKALSRDSRSAKPRPIKNDGKESDLIFKQSLPKFKRLLKSPGAACCCCCGGGGPDPLFARWSMWLDEVLEFKQMIIWDKGPIGMGWHYRRSYETILVAEMPGSKNWFEESGKIENIIRPNNRYGIKKIIPSAKEHPTPKPPELASMFINLHTMPGHVVLDPFMGSGSTAIAAIRAKRKFIGIELDPKWFDLACKRVENESRQLTLF